MSGWIENKLSRRFETCVYAVVGLIGAVLRLYHLDDVPMSETEAAAALSALGLVANDADMGFTGRLPLSPLLHTLQAGTFWLCGSATTSLARLWPALAGSVLVIGLPIVLRQHIGRGASLICVLLLAISPAAWSVSRTGDGMSLALLCGLAMAHGWQLFTARLKRHGLSLAAVALGAGLAAGPNFVTILFIASVFFVVHRRSIRHWWMLLAPELPKVAQAVGLSFLLWSTACGIYPLGLAAVGDSWFTWLANWIPVNDQRHILLVLSLVILHEPVSLLLGITGIYLLIRGTIKAENLVSLSGLGLFFGVVYGGRQASDIVWVLLPVTLLTAIVIDKAWNRGMAGSVRLIVCWQVAALTMLVGFGYVIMASFAAGRSAQWLAAGWDAALQLAILLILCVLVVLLFATGWSRSLAVSGVVTAMFIVLVGWSAHSRALLVGGETEDGLDIWYGERTSSSADIMLESLEDISLRSVGGRYDLQIAVLGRPDVKLAWLLRDYPNLEWIHPRSKGLTSPVVIGYGGASAVAPGAQYLGEEFGYNVYRRRSPGDSFEWARYLLFRRGPVRQTSLVLWVRADVQLEMGTAG
ncbi:MAG: hypothetical protein QF660_03285 [Anaerolineales bacterium]|nr:hypothetical protein [Anaerolineales bacterium]